MQTEEGMGITLVDDLLDWGGRALQDYRPHFGTDRPISSTPPSWYITPRQTFLELIVWNVFFWSALWYMLKRTGFPGPLQLPRRGKRSITGFEKLMGGVVLITLSWVLWYKYKTNTVVYILQPCHIVSVLLIYLCWCSNVRTGSLVFAIFTHTNVGTLLAIGFPDTSDYHRRGYMTHFTVCLYVCVCGWVGVCVCGWVGLCGWVWVCTRILNNAAVCIF